MSWEDIVKENPARNNSMRKEDARRFAEEVMEFISDELDMRYEKLRKYKPLGSDDTPYSNRYVKFKGNKSKDVYNQLYNLYFEVEFMDGKGHAE